MTKLDLHLNDVPVIELLTDKEISKDIKTLELMIATLKDLQETRQQSLFKDDVDLTKFKDWLSNNWSCNNCKSNLDKIEKIVKDWLFDDWNPYSLTCYGCRQNMDKKLTLILDSLKNQKTL